MTELVLLSVPADLEHPSLLREAVLGLSAPLAEYGVLVSVERLQLWGLAVYEAATNVARHAGARGMTLEVVLEAPGVVLRLFDRGKRHDGFAALTPPAELAEGGYGLWIIRGLMHEVRYQRTPGGTNVLDLVGCWPVCERCTHARPVIGTLP